MSHAINSPGSLTDVLVLFQPILFAPHTPAASQPAGRTPSPTTV